MSFKKDVIEKLSSIEKQMGINNHILDEHQRRSTNLEERIVPLEQSHVFSNKLAKAISGIIAGLAGIAAVYHYLLK